VAPKAWHVDRMYDCHTILSNTHGNLLLNILYTEMMDGKQMRGEK